MSISSKFLACITKCMILLKNDLSAGLIGHYMHALCAVVFDLYLSFFLSNLHSNLD